MYPTPTTVERAMSAESVAKANANGQTVRLAGAVTFFPTPTATPYGSGQNGCPHDGRESFAGKGAPSLQTVARDWEESVAPPTDIGSPLCSGTSTGGGTTSPRAGLNPRFVEALMGFPPGWAMLPSPQLSLLTTPPPTSSSPPSATPSSPSAPSPSDGSSDG